MAGIVSMGKFTAVGMRAKVPEGSIVVNTCSGNDGAEYGDDTHWNWANPTNRRFPPQIYFGHQAASVECLWQGFKVYSLRGDGSTPNLDTLAGDWRLAKGKKPLGHWDGPGRYPINDPGKARRQIYIPNYRHQIEQALIMPHVRKMVMKLRDDALPVFLRDHDTGRGVDQPKPMSHAWLLAVYLNTGLWPN